MISLKAILTNLGMPRSLAYTVWFNFHYLPFRQAVKLPIRLYKPRLKACKGRVVIQSDCIRSGMIRLGFNKVPVYPDTGIFFENHGGTVIFRGECSIGNASAISVGDKSTVSFGHKFAASAAIKIISVTGMDFGTNVRFGYECLCMDTDWHRLKIAGEPPRFAGSGYGKIRIGSGCWIGMRTSVMKNTVLPGQCVVCSNSVLNKPYDIKPKSLLAGLPAKLKKEGIYRDMDDDRVVIE